LEIFWFPQASKHKPKSKQRSLDSFFSTPNNVKRSRVDGFNGDDIEDCTPLTSSSDINGVGCGAGDAISPPVVEGVATATAEDTPLHRELEQEITPVPVGRGPAKDISRYVHRGIK
jgi:hypothetical protein